MASQPQPPRMNVYLVGSIFGLCAAVVLVLALSNHPEWATSVATLIGLAVLCLNVLDRQAKHQQLTAQVNENTQITKAEAHDTQRKVDSAVKEAKTTAEVAADKAKEAEKKAVMAVAVTAKVSEVNAAATEKITEAVNRVSEQLNGDMDGRIKAAVIAALLESSFAKSSDLATLKKDLDEFMQYVHGKNHDFSTGLQTLMNKVEILLAVTPAPTTTPNGEQTPTSAYQSGGQ